MPPALNASSYPDDIDPLALLDDAVWEMMEEPVLPPISGGQLPAFLGDAWAWTLGNLLAPGGDFLRAAMSEIGRIVGGTVTTIASWLLKWVYHIVRFSMWYAVPSAHRLGYPSVYNETTQSPYEYLSRIFRIMGSVIEGIADPLFGWLWRAVAGHVEWAIREIRSGAAWLWGAVAGHVEWAIREVRSWAAWLWDQVASHVMWAIREVRSWAAWLWDQVAGHVMWAIREVRSWAAWLWDAVAGHVEWAIREAREGVTWLWDAVAGHIEWAIREVRDAADWLYHNVILKIPEGIIAGAAEIGKLIREAFEWLVTSVFEPFVDVVQAKLAIPGKLIRAEYTSLEELLEDMMDPPAEMLKGWTGMILLPFIVVGLLVNMVTGLSGPLLEPVLQEQARSVGARIPPFAMLRDGLLRDLLPVGAHDEWLGRSGFDAANIELQKALYEEIPGPTDLVRMGVREVFTPEIAERFGQFEDLPPAFVDWMGRQGYTEEWSRNFWAAHWDLPSITQGFAMFHRDVIPEEELQVLLRALDVMPYWREKLTDIAYRVITRVDVRRMYAEGVFDRDQVKRVYQDLGYKPEDAEALTEFVVLRYPPKGAETADDLRSVTVTTIKQALARRLITEDDALDGLQELDYAPGDARLIISIWQFDWTQDPSLRSDVDPKGLARSVIEKAYERRLIDFNGGVRELGELGYTPEDARLLLQLVDLRLEEQLADLEIDGLLSDYQDGAITDAQFAAALADLHVPEARVEFLLRREILGRQAKRRRLTLAQMKKAVAEDLMGVEEYQARLGVMGYNPRDAEILVALNVESV
ncbi:hypothetical protein LCGC14_0768040 [marine sediment metagenome]|uniref:Uncharacterized protein n=1 Tax=marine sediment metagenome TaxID=412755 RepID=A0A0F9T626_9ZZZZ